MKSILFTICFTAAMLCNGQEKKIEKSNNYIQIKDDFKSATLFALYKFNPLKNCNQTREVSIIKENRISKCFDYIRIIKGNDVKNILEFLYDSNNYGGEEVPCFDTSYSLLAYSSNNKIIGYINISLGCNKLLSNPTIKEQGKPSNIGFSKSGMQQLKKLLKF